MVKWNNIFFLFSKSPFHYMIAEDLISRKKKNDQIWTAKRTWTCRGGFFFKNSCSICLHEKNKESAVCRVYVLPVAVVVVVLLLLVVVKEEAIFCIVESDGKPPEDNLEKSTLPLDVISKAPRRGEPLAFPSTLTPGIAPSRYSWAATKCP